EEDAADREVGGREREADGGVVRDPLDREARRHATCDERDAEPRSSHQDTAAVSASPESSLFAMNLQEGLSSRRQRNDQALPLEVSTIAGGSARAARRSATAKPSRSGSWTSSRTIAGRSPSTAASADAPSAASPTTSKSAASSSARAAARNPGWSSTISTVP